MAATREYLIAPDPSLMEDIGATSFTVAEAVVELVANSLDARYENVSMEIQVAIAGDADTIMIVDNGIGMSESILAEAVRLGVKMDLIAKSKGPRKGMFGLGMKTACASLGRYWAVFTRPVGEDKELFVEFDLASWKKQAGKKDFEWRIQIRATPPNLDGPLGERPHGTAVVIGKLRDPDPMFGPVLVRLGEAYKPHIEAGDHILVNGAEARPRIPEFVDNSRIEIDHRFGTEDKYHIKGWVALDKKIHNDTDFGLNLYRQDQLVEPWNKAWFPVHLMTSRILGDIHLDFVPTNFNKKGFQTQSIEWKAASEQMKELLKPVVRASREMSRGRKDAGKFARAVEGLQKAMGKSGVIGNMTTEGGQAANASASAKAGEEKLRKEVDVQANVLLLDDEKILLAYVVEDLQSELTPWDYIFDAEAGELQAVVNSNSRLFLKVKDEGFLGMLALADSVTSFLVEQRQFEPMKAREIRNRWLFVSLAE